MRTARTSRSSGHRFNPNKLLLDPYARRIAGECAGRTRCSAIASTRPRGDLSFDRRDSAPGMPKAVVTDETLQLGR